MLRKLPRLRRKTPTRHAANSDSSVVSILSCLVVALLVCNVLTLFMFNSAAWRYGDCHEHSGGAMQFKEDIDTAADSTYFLSHLPLPHEPHSPKSSAKSEQMRPSSSVLPEKSSPENPLLFTLDDGFLCDFTIERMFNASIATVKQMKKKNFIPQMHCPEFARKGWRPGGNYVPYIFGNNCEPWWARDAVFIVGRLLHTGMTVCFFMCMHCNLMHRHWSMEVEPRVCG